MEKPFYGIWNVKKLLSFLADLPSPYKRLYIVFSLLLYNVFCYIYN